MVSNHHETGHKVINWGEHVKNNINFINEKPTLAPEKATPMTLSTDINLDDLSNHSQDGEDKNEEKKEAMKSDLEHALMIKRSDPL